MLCVVSVVDSISATSMPVNEFVIYRSTHNYSMHQVLIVCDNKAPANVSMPDNIRVYFVDHNRHRIKEAVTEIKREYANDSIVFHMHHQKSALSFLMATVGMGVRKKTLYTVHSTFSARDFKYRVSSCICALFSEYTNCVSNAAFVEYAAWVKKIKKKNFLTILNGVDVDRIDGAIVDNPATKDRKTMVCVGRMIPLKNHEFLIRLLPKLPDYRLILVGAEDSGGKIRKLAKDIGVIDKIEFTGLISRDDVFKKLNSASIYVSASHIEGLPVSVLEAMRVGLIPIVSDIMPHKEIAKQCDGVCVLPLNQDDWIQKIKFYGQMKQENFENKTQTIRNSVKVQFSLDRMHTQYLEVYSKLAN